MQRKINILRLCGLSHQSLVAANALQLALPTGLLSMPLRCKMTASPAPPQPLLLLPSRPWRIKKLLEQWGGTSPASLIGQRFRLRFWAWLRAGPGLGLKSSAAVAPGSSQATPAPRHPEKPKQTGSLFVALWHCPLALAHRRNHDSDPQAGPRDSPQLSGLPSPASLVFFQRPQQVKHLAAPGPLCLLLPLPPDLDTAGP